MTIRLKSESGLRCGYKPCLRQPGRAEMTFVVRGRYRLAPGEPLALVRSDEIPRDVVEKARLHDEKAADRLELASLALGQGSVTGDLYEEGDEGQVGAVLYPSDFADYKPKADVMLRASCHAPRKTDTECEVAFRVGDWKKTLKVVGHRVWVDRAGGGKHTDPKPVDVIAVDYAHAYGGPGFENNPIGKGHVEKVEGDADDLYQPPRSVRSQVMPSQQLPNVVYPDGKEHKDGVPAGFAPLNPSWKLRSQKLGKKYDQEWLDTRAPCFAADMDWTYFNAAPPDQQLDGYLRGDEEIAFENLHPVRAKLSTRLPGVRVRVFIRDVEANAREIAMKLDTLFADLEEGSLYLTWRGVTTVKEEDLTDVELGLVVTEPLADAPRPAKDYLAELEAFAADPIGLNEALPEGFTELAARAEKLESATDRELEALLENEEGNSPPVAMFKNLFGALAPAGLDALDATWAKAEGQEGVEKGAMKEKLLDGLAESTRGAPGAGGGAPGGGARATSAPSGGVGMRLPVREGEKPIFPIGIVFREHEKKLVELKKALPKDAGPEAAAKIDAALVKIRTNPELLAADPHYRPYSEDDPPPDEPGPGADLRGRDLSDRDLRGADLSGADLQCAILSHTSLEGANLEGAKLGGARLERANLSRANLRGVDLTSASFDRVTAHGADLGGSRLDLFRATKSDFTGASFAGAEGQLATFGRSIFAKADFSKASLMLSSFDGCDLEAARFGAKLEHVRFTKCEARGIVLEGAELVGASFNDCRLQGARASGVRGDGAVFFRSSLEKASFQKADLTASHFHGVDAVDASFERAHLPKARFDRAILRQATFERASLLGADLRKASLTRANFRKACLHDAKLTQTAGIDVDFEGADMVGVDVQRSKITTAGGGSR
jgi:uncharacterized protein YjbI with pentapeptide repeats